MRRQISRIQVDQAKDGKLIGQRSKALSGLQDALDKPEADSTGAIDRLVNEDLQK